MVSMLNVLSFFFILKHDLYMNIMIEVSMLNVLSFFFMLIMPEWFYRSASRVSMLNVLSFFFIIN